jgi:predicted dithiol-disulfide oxidoreductase (DUF899 family)
MPRQSNTLRPGGFSSTWKFGKKRMGWSFKWVSSSETDFNFDYHVSFTPEELAKKEAFYHFKVQDPRNSEHAGVTVFYKNPTGSDFTPIQLLRVASTC